MKRFNTEFQTRFGNDAASQLQRELLEIIGPEGKTFVEIRRAEYLRCSDNRAATTADALSELLRTGMIRLMDGRFELQSRPTSFEAA